MGREMEPLKAEAGAGLEQQGLKRILDTVHNELGMHEKQFTSPGV